jgi:hypothetical protein
MEEVFRSIVGRLNESVRGYLKPRRRNSRLPIIVSIQPNIQTKSLLKNELAARYAEKKRNLSTAGETFDISEGGISFIVPFIRLGEHYLVSEGTTLNLQIELPEGQLNLKAVGCRYEQIDIESTSGRFLVGARIIGMSEKDRSMFQDHVASQKGSGQKRANHFQWDLDLS